MEEEGFDVVLEERRSLYQTAFRWWPASCGMWGLAAEALGCGSRGQRPGSREVALDVKSSVRLRSGLTQEGQLGNSRRQCLRCQREQFR